ncbi:paraquat-inducible protein A [Colwelliaceae bacterium 6441]
MMIKHLGFILNLLAIALFIPGVLQPMFSLSMDVMAQTNISSLSSELINKELSLIETITELYQDDRILVAGLILFFSLIIPLIKSALLSFSYFSKNNHLARKVANVVNMIGKWSMADVFVVAIFLAIMSTNHAKTQTEHQLSLFNFKVDILMSSSTLSSVGIGFYYFTGYCIVSMIASQLSYFALARQKQ